MALRRGVPGARARRMSRICSLEAMGLGRLVGTRWDGQVTAECAAGLVTARATRSIVRATVTPNPTLEAPVRSGTTAALLLLVTACGGSATTTTTDESPSTTAATISSSTTEPGPVTDAFAVSAVVDPAAAPDPGLEPTIGYDYLSPVEGVVDHNPIDSGWQNTLEVSGTIPATTISPECAGFVNRDAYYEISWAGSTGETLRFIFNADNDSDDAVFVVHDPDGNWWCADDSYGTLDPTIEIADSPNGIYLLFMGTKSGSTISGLVTVTIDPDAHP